MKFFLVQFCTKIKYFLNMKKILTKLKRRVDNHQRDLGRGSINVLECSEDKSVGQRISDRFRGVCGWLRDLLNDRSRENQPAGCRRKELSTLSKILMGVCFAAIPTTTKVDSLSSRVHYAFLWMAILLMFVGIYLQVKLPKLSNILQRIGHIFCLIGLMIMQDPVLNLPLAFSWVPPLLVSLILFGVMCFAG